MIFRRNPPVPSGARLNRADGEVIPLELVYLGRKKKMFHWEAVLTVESKDGDTVSIDVVPPQTTIRIGFWMANRSEDDR